MLPNLISALNTVGTKAKLETRNGKLTKVPHQAELEEQAALIEWADKTVIDGVKIGNYLLHIPNEGKRGPKAAKDAKRLGVRAGVPDLVLALPRDEYAGYRTVCCFGFNQASSGISEYINRGNENVPC
ncbi:hypothetical protein [Pectobacterium carotovorum]|uniref:hypothetical protein n=1 Tax=Pectobacterium carotovorum TaxID=554 RepID=UPI001D1915FE|nr:hypothetical protein [Pectobacterium carotovorum]